jgi:hypothetical protein
LSLQPQGKVIAISSLTKDSKLDKKESLEVTRGGIVNLYSLNEKIPKLITTLKSDRPYSSFGSKIKVTVIETNQLFLFYYSISNEFRPFASPYRTPTVPPPYPSVPHRTRPYPPFLSFLRPKSVKNGGYGEVR